MGGGAKRKKAALLIGEIVLAAAVVFLYSIIWSRGGKINIDLFGTAYTATLTATSIILAALGIIANLQTPGAVKDEMFRCHLRSSFVYALLAIGVGLYGICFLPTTLPDDPALSERIATLIPFHYNTAIPISLAMQLTLIALASWRMVLVLFKSTKAIK